MEERADDRFQVLSELTRSITRAARELAPRQTGRSVLTIPWGTSRHQEFFLLNMGIKHVVSFGSLGPGTRSVLATLGCAAPLQHRAKPQHGETSDLHTQQTKFSYTQCHHTPEQGTGEVAEIVTAA